MEYGSYNCRRTAIRDALHGKKQIKRESSTFNFLKMQAVVDAIVVLIPMSSILLEESTTIIAKLDQ
jgi:hypothetical protein